MSGQPVKHPIQWPAEAIWEAVAPNLPGFTVEVVSEMASTNTELMRRARDGQLAPVLLVAERQTAGRGRLGRDWTSEPAAGQVAKHGASLTFSLGLPLAPRDWSGLSLAVGLSVVDSLHPALALKWPNDVWLHDRKLAGILIETANSTDAAVTRFAVVGVGINLRSQPAQGLRTPPASLDELLPALDAPQTLLRLIQPLVQAILRFEQQGFAPLQARFNARDALSDVAVSLSDGTTGIAQGVDANGALRVQTEQGLKTITSAEVSVRPLNPPRCDGV